MDTLRINKGRKLDVVMAIGAIAAVAVAYIVGYVLIDLTEWLSVNAWQAHPDHIGGVRLFAGACALGVLGIVLSLWANR